MKKHFVKFVCLIVSVLFAAFTGAGCKHAGSGATEPVDETKTQLTVGLVSNGYGSSWLYKAIERFEEQFKETEFEPGSGRKGVQVHVIPVEYGNTLITTLQNVQAEVIFTQNADYNAFVKSGKMKKLTEVVKGSLEEFGDEGSIEDKLPESTAQAYRTDGEYYAIPFVYNNYGFIYDIDVFEDYGLYLAADTSKTSDTVPSQNYPAKKSGNNYIYVNAANPTKSAGPNGVIGDYDDGLPATYDQFFALTKRMQSSGVVPFTAAGAQPGYISFMMKSLLANNEGAKNYALNHTMSGSATTLIDTINDDGSFTLQPETNITEANAWKLYGQAGRYYALDFLERLIDDGNNYDRDQVFKKEVSHTDAQTYFISSKKYDEKPTAMLLDGMHWENEATSSFKSMERLNTADEKWGKSDRNFGYLPFPKPTDDMIGRKSVVFAGTDELVFISSYADESKVDVAGKFIQFTHTNRSLSEFTRETSLMRPFGDYMKDNTSDMTTFGKSVYDYVVGSDIVNHPFCDTYLLNFSRFHNEAWYATISGTATTYPSEEFRKGTSAVDYFRGIVARTTESYWNNSIYKG